MELDFAVLADGITQRGDGKLDIYGAGWDTIYTSGVPTRHPRISFVARLLLTQNEAEHEHRIQVILQAADGQEVAKADGQLEIPSAEEVAAMPPGRKLGVGLILSFEDLIFAGYGAYQIALLVDGREVREPLRLFVAEIPSE